MTLPVLPVVLATDALFFLLLLLLGGYAVYAVKRSSALEPWRKLARSRGAMISLTILSFYVAVAFLDSLHFKPRIESDKTVYSNEILSVFDVLVTPLRRNQEKTYSRPLAVHGFVKEMLEDKDGQRYRGYPRLTHGGAHLADPAQRMRDVWLTAAVGFARGLIASLLVVALLCAVRARCRGAPSGRRFIPRFITAGCELVRGQTELPWRAIAVTLSVMLVAMFVIAQLGSQYHLLGTDKVGEDVLYQALKSIRTGFLIGTLTTLVMLPFALLLGITAGYFLGWVDDVIQYVYTTLNSIPGVLLIAAAVLMLHLYMNQHQDEFSSLAVRADTRLLFLCLILGVTSWTGLCRLLRAETLKVKSMDYIQAARVLGVARFTLIVRHILPNVMHIVFITIALDFSGLVLAEAVLSYIDIGVDPTMHSWGNMINSARLEMAREPVVWWPLAASLVFMFGLVLAANLFSDAVRNAFDPRTAVSRLSM